MFILSVENFSPPTVATKVILVGFNFYKFSKFRIADLIEHSP